MEEFSLFTDEEMGTLSPKEIQHEKVFPHTSKDIAQMKEYVSNYSYDELLSADVRCEPSEYIDYFMVGKAIGNNLSDDEWDTYKSCNTDELVQSFLAPKYKGLCGNELGLSKVIFVTDMGVTAVAYEKGVFPVEDDDD